MKDYDYRPAVGWHDYSEDQERSDALNAARESHDVIADEDGMLGIKSPTPDMTTVNRGAW